MLQTHRSLEDLLCNQPYEEDDEDDEVFLIFHFNGAPVE
jgi:hypothetical protein